MDYSEEITETTYINNHKLFPRVVLLQIYYYLDIKSLFNCSLVSKHFNKLFNSDMLWDKLVCDRYDADEIDQVKQRYNTNNSKTVYKIIGDLLIIDKMFELEGTIDELINMQQLNLDYDGLAELPREIGSLINLRKLYVNDNQLT